MKFSVAICTWNRADLLKQTLEHFCQLRDDDRFAWELIIVNNNSTDDTDKVIHEFAERLPIISVFEPIQGHSQSRNAAVAHATGDYLIWTDNDVLVDPNWLTAYYEAMVVNPHIVFWGGPIEPQFESPCPLWLEQTWEICKPVFATRMLGDAPLPLDEKTLPYGANFAIRLDVQRQFLYDTRFGRKANGMQGEDETAVLRKIAQAGHAGLWVPAARLQHFIPDDRATEAYIRRYFVAQGLTNIACGKIVRNRWGAFLESWYCTFLYRVKRHFAPPIQWVSHMIRASLSWGEFQAPRIPENQQDEPKD
jgi:glycosyltransferase involved in cell wall biosynthesis